MEAAADRALRNTVLKENGFKNALVVVVLILAWGSIAAAMGGSLNASNADTFLLLDSILLVTVSFATFAFSYEYSQMRSPGVRFLAYACTFLFLLLTGLLLEVAIAAVHAAYPALAGLVAMLSLLLYISIVLYDFWDIQRFFRTSLT